MQGAEWLKECDLISSEWRHTRFLVTAPSLFSSVREVAVNDLLRSEEMIAVNHGADEAQNFHDKFKDLHLDQSGRGQYDCAPVFDLFIQYSEDLFSQIPEASAEKLVKEVESYFSLVLSMLQFLEEPGHLDRFGLRVARRFRNPSVSGDSTHTRLGTASRCKF